MKGSSARAAFPGILLAMTTGVAVWFVSSFVHWIDPLVAGIVFGMILRTVIGERASLLPGLRWTPRILIPPGIILYGAHLHFNLETVSPITWLQILVGLTIVIWLARTVGRWLKLPDPTTLLLAVGTAVCGASAIVIASDTAGGTKRDTTTALLVITLWGIVGLIVLPLVADHFAMSVPDRALLYATTLQQTGLVKAAAAQSGSACLELAMAIKTARIITIIPLLLIVGTFAYWPQLKDNAHGRGHFRIRIPWYLWGFIVAGVCFTYLPSVQAYTAPALRANEIVWTMAMVSIGLTVDARSVIRSLGRPVLAGLIIWIGLLLVFVYTYSNAYL